MQSTTRSNNISERGVRPLKTQQKISGRLASDDVTQDRLDIRSYIDTARKHGKQCHGRPARPHARQALATARAGILPVTGNRNPRYPSPRVHGLIVYDRTSAWSPPRSAILRIAGSATSRHAE